MNTATAPHTAGPDLDAEAAEFRRLTGVMRALNHGAEKVRSTRDMTVYRLLVDSGLTQAQLADVLGVSPATVQASVRNARQEELPELNFSDTYQQGRWLRELRLRQSMTKQDLARNLGVPKSWVDAVESGDARLGDGRLPRAFDVLGANVRRFQAYGWPDISS